MIARAALLLVVLLAGCSTPKDASTTVQPGSSAADPLEARFAQAPNAAEWLMNPKHTLRDYSPEHAVQMLGALNQAGAVEVRVSDIAEDAGDSSFKNAGTVLIQFPSSEGARKPLFDIFRERGIPLDDQGQKYLEVEVGILRPNVPG